MLTVLIWARYDGFLILGFSARRETEEEEGVCDTAPKVTIPITFTVTMSDLSVAVSGIPFPTPEITIMQRLPFMSDHSLHVLSPLCPVMSPLPCVMSPLPHDGSPPPRVVSIFSNP